MSNYADFNEHGPGKKRDKKPQQNKDEEFLTLEERNEVRRYLAHPEDWPVQAMAYIQDWLQVNGLDIPVTALRGFNRYVYEKGTTFPTDPEDGQPFTYAVDTDNGIYWTFRYNKDITDGYPWVFESGQAPYQNTTTEESTASSAFADLATVVTITVPLAGKYELAFGSTYENSEVDKDVVMGMKYSAGTPLDNESIQGEGIVTTGSQRQAGARIIQATIAAGYSVKPQYHGGTSGTAFFRNRWFKVTPIRVAAS